MSDNEQQGKENTVEGMTGTSGAQAENTGQAPVTAGEGEAPGAPGAPAQGEETPLSALVDAGVTGIPGSAALSGAQADGTQRVELPGIGHDEAAGPGGGPEADLGAESDPGIDAEIDAGPSEPSGSSDQAGGDEPFFPSPFESIPEEKLAKAKRTKRTLIIVIILLALLLLGVAAGAVYYYLSMEDASATIEHAGNVIEDGSVTQDRGTTETIEMPDLVKMFGKTPEEVLKTLGPDYSITNTGTTAAEDASEAETDENGDGTEDAEGDEASTTTSQVTTISYTPQEQASTYGTTHVLNIYLTLDESGATREVYFAGSMSLLDYPISNFADLVAAKTSLADTLRSAGATMASDTPYTAPTEDEYTIYVDPSANKRLIRKETVTVTGSLASEQAPKNFEVTYTYDYGASGVEISPDRQPSQRMLYIKLW